MQGPGPVGSATKYFYLIDKVVEAKAKAKLATTCSSVWSHTISYQAETELDLQTELLGKIKTIERLNTFITQFFIVMDILHSDENKILYEM